MTPTPNERSADALAEALRALNLAKGNFIAAQGDLTSAMARWDEDSKPTPFYCSVHAVRDNARTNAKLLEDARKRIEAALTQHDAASSHAKIVCHVEGDRCLGCDHYYGKSDACKYAQHDAAKKEPASGAMRKGATHYHEKGNYTAFWTELLKDGKLHAKIWVPYPAWEKGASDQARLESMRLTTTLAQHDAAKAESASGAQCEDSARVQWAIDLLEPHVEQHKNCNRSAPYFAEAITVLIRAARAARGEEGGT